MREPSKDDDAPAVPPRRVAVGGLLRLLLSLVLLLQLGGVPAFADPSPAPPSAEASALARLSAAIGQPVSLCLRGGSHEPAPGGHDDCDHCILCNLMADAAARGPADPVHVVRVAVALAAYHPAKPAPTRSTHDSGGSRPRGPPPLV